MTSFLRQINIEVAVILKDQTSQVPVQNAMVSMTWKAEWKDTLTHCLLRIFPLPSSTEQTPVNQLV